MPSRSRPARTPPVVLDDAAWGEDLLRASTAARRACYEKTGAKARDAQLWQHANASGHCTANVCT